MTLTRLVSCFGCGVTRGTFRKVDMPVEGYVCTRCVKVSRSAVVKVGKAGVLVGPLAERLGREA